MRTRTILAFAPLQFSSVIGQSSVKGQSSVIFIRLENWGTAKSTILPLYVITLPDKRKSIGNNATTEATHTSRGEEEEREQESFECAFRREEVFKCASAHLDI